MGTIPAEIFLSLALAGPVEPGNISKTTIADLPPVVVKTVPASGAENVDQSLTSLKATFSKDMINGNWSWVQISKEHFPKIDGKVSFEKDKRTCVLPVKLEPNQTYVLWLNRGKFSSFMDTDKHPAVPYLLVFKTGAAK